jgi:hypothetical protein
MHFGLACRIDAPSPPRAVLASFLASASHRTDDCSWETGDPASTPAPESEDSPLVNEERPDLGDSPPVDI